MKEINISGIKLWDIQVFLMAAETLNYSTVARAMNVTQSAVSKSIARFEADTKLILFVRHGGKVHLTPAGKKLQGSLSEMIGIYEKGVEEAHIVQTGLDNTLRIGFPTTEDTSFVVSYAEKLHKEFENCHITVDIYDFATLRNKFIENKLDVIFTSLFETDSLKDPEISWKLVDSMPLCAFIPQSNPLSEKESITIGDLKGEKFIVHSPSMVPGYINLINSICAPYGFTPVISRYAESIGTFIMALIMGEGIVIGDEIIKQQFPESVKCFPLEGTSSGKIIAWKASNPGRALRRFIQICSRSNS